MVRVADCVPVLIYDDNKGVIAVAHSGRSGSFLSIVPQTITKMMYHFDSHLQHIKVVLGPAIGGCCYEVNKELITQAQALFPLATHSITDRCLDLQGIIVLQLEQMGIPSHSISVQPICTKCSGEPYYSYRNGGDSRRFAGVMVNDNL